MHDVEAVCLGELVRDERAVAGLRVALDAEQRGGAVLRHARDDCVEVSLVEDLPPVALGVLRGELAVRPLADAAQASMPASVSAAWSRCAFAPEYAEALPAGDPRPG
jgi:hypothetical protein